MTLETDLTLEQVRQLAEAKNYPHPVAELIRSQLADLQQAARTQTLTRPFPPALFSLTEKMEKLEPFSLTGTDLVGIWAEIMTVEDKEVEERQSDAAFGQAITMAHVAKVVNDPNWREAPTLWLKETMLPATNVEELLLVRQSLDQLSTQLSLLRPLTARPIDKSSTDLLVSTLSQGTEEQQNAILNLLRNSTVRAHPLLIALNHGLGHAIGPIRSEVIQDLRHLGVKTDKLPTF